MPMIKISITIPADLGEQIEIRDVGLSRSGVIARDLGRYYEGLRRARLSLRGRLTEQQLGFLLDTAKYAIREDIIITPELLPALIKEAVASERADPAVWSVDYQSMAAEISSYDYLMLCALAEGLAQWWRRYDAGEEPSYNEVIAGLKPLPTTLEPKE